MLHDKAKLPLGILLVDDSPTFLAAATNLIISDPRLAVIGTALSGQDALNQVLALKPGLIVMDLAMPEMDGLEVTRRIKAQLQPPPIIIVTIHDLPRYRTAAVSAGADGFVTKSAFSIEIIPLIEQFLTP